jgi:hypothetical protein
LPDRPCCRTLPLHIGRKPVDLAGQEKLDSDEMIGTKSRSGDNLWSNGKAHIDPPQTFSAQAGRRTLTKREDLTRR